MLIIEQLDHTRDDDCTIRPSLRNSPIVAIPIVRQHRGTDGFSFVRQQHFTGCAIACVAMVAGRTYDEAHALSGKRGKGDKSLWEHEIVGLLRTFGIRSRFVEGHVLNRRPAILMFDWVMSSGTHCVVWDPRKVHFIDPDHGEQEELVESELWIRSGRCAVLCTPISDDQHGRFRAQDWG